MKTVFVMLAVVAGVLLIGNSQSLAQYVLCSGYVFDSIGLRVANAYVRGENCNDVFLYAYSGVNGYYALTSATPPPTGWYTYCARKDNVGKDVTSIYHTYGTADSWNPHLSGYWYPCPNPCEK